MLLACSEKGMMCKGPIVSALRPHLTLAINT